jgi:hypothetical protein
LAFFISTENLYLVEKQNKENFVDSGIVKTCDELDHRGKSKFRRIMLP